MTKTGAENRWVVYKLPPTADSSSRTAVHLLSDDIIPARDQTRRDLPFVFDPCNLSKWESREYAVSRNCPARKCVTLSRGGKMSHPAPGAHAAPFREPSGISGDGFHTPDASRYIFPLPFLRHSACPSCRSSQEAWPHQGDESPGDYWGMTTDVCPPHDD
jgi:hypothetical protein